MSAPRRRKKCPPLRLVGAADSPKIRVRRQPNKPSDAEPLVPFTREQRSELARRIPIGDQMYALVQLETERNRWDIPVDDVYRRACSNIGMPCVFYIPLRLVAVNGERVQA